MGVPLMRTKTWAYATGAFFGGIAGAYFASFKSATFPDDFNFNISVFILCMVILGGMGNIWGVIFGAAFLAYLDHEGLANIGRVTEPASVAEHRRAEVRVRDLRRHHRGRDAVPARGPDTERAPQSGVPRGRPRHTALRPRVAMTDGSNSGALLVAEQVRKEFGGLVAVDDVDFMIPRDRSSA